MQLNFEDWGLVPYDVALRKQEDLFNRKVEQKLLSQGEISEDFIVCTHPVSYTHLRAHET